MESDLVGGSLWEEQLYRHVKEHLSSEQSILDEYRSAALQSSSPAFAYLAGLIIDDEQRHHAHFADLAASIKQLAALDSGVLTVPALDSPSDREELLALTDRLLDAEKADKRELRRLAHEFDDVARTTPWRLLVELMEADTDKHIHILEFVKSWLRHR